MLGANHYEKVKEAVSKFKDGEKRFQTSPLFNQVIQMLVRDVDPVDIIDSLINVAEDSQKALGTHLLNG